MSDRTVLALTLAGALAGCASVGPDYQRPESELPAAWGTPPEAGQTVGAARWWTVFGDPALGRLMDEALTHNANLALALARVDEARALLGVARADQFPEASANLGRSRTRSTEVGSVPLPPGVDPLNNSNRATLDVAYELDLWGRYRRATEAARAELLASEAARDAVQLTLTAQVAQGYHALLALDAQIDVTQRTIETRREALELQRRRHDAGVISELDLRQLEAEVQAAQALLPALERSRAQQENALAVLAGRSPRAMVASRIERAAANGAVDTPSVPTVVPTGLPSDLLLRRPDLREAEQRLIAANARIGVARAAYFPSISLTGYLGSESAALSDLFSGPASIWQVAARLTQPLFNAGRVGAQVDAATAREQQLVAQYRLAVQNAFRDMQDALVAQSRSREQLEAEANRAAALAQALKLARLRYEHGVASQLEVLDAERNLLQAELNRVDALRAQRTAVSDIVKALGGGWEPGT